MRDKAKNSETNAKWRALNRERLLQYKREYREKNKERLSAERKAAKPWRKPNNEARRRKHFAENKEKIYAVRKEWSEKNPGKLNEYARQARARKKAASPKVVRKLPPEVLRERRRISSAKYASKNREKRRVDTANRRAADPQKARSQWIASANKRRARKSGATISDVRLIEKWEAAWRKKRHVACYWCRAGVAPSECHTDHIKPLKSGGSHSIDNLCISCQPCNAHKSAKPMERWNASLSEPVLL